MKPWGAEAFAARLTTAKRPDKLPAPMFHLGERSEHFARQERRAPYIIFLM
jgi:hypothetical protein